MLTINDVTSLSSRLTWVPMLRSLFIFMAAVAMLVLLVVPQARGDQALVLRVVNDFSTFDFIASAKGGGRSTSQAIFAKTLNLASHAIL